MRTKQPKSKKVHKCAVCDTMIYGSKLEFNNHLFHHGLIKARYNCSHCFKGYYKREAYNYHMKKHLNKIRMYTCDHCGRSYVDKRNLIVHLKIHVDLNYDRGFYCTACCANFCEQRLLANHIRKNHFSFNDREPPFLKKRLNETWIEKVKGFESYVEITKVNNNVLKIKKLEATEIETEKKEPNFNDGKKGFNEYISSIFTTKNNTQYSMAVCDYCNKEMVKKSLKSHIRERHLRLTRFKCDTCSRNFKRRYQMVNHICGQDRRRKRKIE